MHREVAAELRGHLEDLVAQLQEEGINRDRAEEEACHRLGEPGLLGRELDRIHRPRLNWGLFLTVMLAAAGGLFALAIAPGKRPGDIWFQGGVALAGLVLTLLAPYFDYRLLVRYKTPLYIAGLALVVLDFRLPGGAYFPASVGLAAALCFLVVSLASLVVLLEKEPSWALRAKTWGLCLLPVVLLIMGHTVVWAVVLGGTLLAMFRGAGFSRIKIIAGLVAGLLAAFLYLATLAPPYITTRLLYGWLKPLADPTSAGYLLLTIRQHLAAGGTFGAGIGNDQAALLPPLPEASRELILAPVMQQTGWPGGLILMTFLLALLLFLFRAFNRTDDLYGRVLGYGITAFLGIRFAWNTAMIFGLLPLAGIGLPFVSYGPSFLALDFCLVALALNITARQPGRALIPDGGGNDPI